MACYGRVPAETTASAKFENEPTRNRKAQDDDTDIHVSVRIKYVHDTKNTSTQEPPNSKPPFPNPPLHGEVLAPGCEVVHPRDLDLEFSERFAVEERGGGHVSNRIRLESLCLTSVPDIP